MPTYLKLSTALPAIPVPTTGALIPGTSVPLVSQAMTLNQTTGATAKFNRQLVESNMVARHGGGLYAVGRGLGLAIGAGLLVTVAAGHAVIDGPVVLAAATSVAVPNTITDGTLWLTQAGTVSPSTDLTPPAGNCCLLGFFSTAGGVVTEVDESGVLRLEQGNLALRRCADTGTPQDAPPATVRFLTRCPGGLFLWDGEEHLALSGGAAGTVVKSGLLATDVTFTAAEARNRFLRFEGALTQDIDAIVPADEGREWVVQNDTTDGGGGPWTVTLKTPAGTGVAVAHARTAMAMCDGVDVRRVTADVA